MRTDFKVYARKIDIYVVDARGFVVYECSTHGSKTCTEAKERFAYTHDVPLNQVRAHFTKKER